MQPSRNDQNFEKEIGVNGNISPNVFIEKPYSTGSDVHPVNGNYAPDDEDDDDDDGEEEDLILGDENEISGDEVEFEVELEEDIDAADLDEDDLVIDTEDDEEENDDL
ncbi:MAG: hypothetical protein ACXWB9_00815 [Flavisolibacter sp.]